MQELYALYAPLVYNNNWDPILNRNGAEKCQDMPDEPVYPSEGSLYDALTPENNLIIQYAREQKMFYIKDKHMDCALWRTVLSLLLQEIQ